MSMSHFRLDAAPGVHTLRQLEHVSRRVYEKKFLEFRAREFIAPSPDPAPAFMKKWTVQILDELGRAKVVTNRSTDLPRVDVAISEESRNLRLLGDSYGIDFMEQQSSDALNIPLLTRKGIAARRAIEQLIDDILCFGDASNGLEGFLNNSDVDDDEAATVDGNVTWADKIANEDHEAVLRDLTGAVQHIIDATDGMLPPTDIAVPDAEYALLAQTRLLDQQTTLLKFFLESNPYVQRVRPWHRLKGAGADGSNRMLVYRLDEEVAHYQIPLEFQQLPPQQQGLEQVVNCVAVCGGVGVLHPAAMLYIDGIGGGA
jgi:hypothetical protein